MKRASFKRGMLGKVVKITITNFMTFICSLSVHRRAFYSSANTIIFGKVGRVASEEVVLQLINTRNVLDCNQSNYSSRIIFSCTLP